MIEMFLARPIMDIAAQQVNFTTFFTGKLIRFLGYGKSYKDGRGYNGRSTGPSSLIQAAPKKRVQLRPVQVNDSFIWVILKYFI